MFQEKLLTRTYCDEAENYSVPYVLSPSYLVFRPDLPDITWAVIIRSWTVMLLAGKHC